MALCVAAIVALAACQPASRTSTPTPTASGIVQTGGALRVAIGSEPTTLDPWNADPSALLVTRQIFETLVAYDVSGLRVVPALAESWSVSSDGRIWTFVLRRGVKFHDGTDLDAAAVALNLDRARMTAHPLRGGTGPERFRAYAALLEGFDDASVITKVDAKDTTTVAITTRTPFGSLLADLAMPSFAIVSPKSMRDDPVGWSTVASASVAGTGAFAFRAGAWQQGQIALQRNSSYWLKDAQGGPLPYADRVVFRVVRDDAARIAELRSGGIDATRDLLPATVATVKADPNLQLLVRPAFNTTYLAIGSASPPFDKVEVRRAVAMAIDKPLLATALYSGLARPATQLVVPGLLGYDDSVVEFYRYDGAAAKRLLADAGVPNGFATELWYPPAWRAHYPEPKRVAESIAADLAKIGIVATVRSEDAASYRADTAAARLPLWLGDATGDSGDPDSFFGDGAGWASDVVRELLRRARYEADASKRTELYKQVSKLIQQDATRVPLLHSDSLIAATKKVRGLVPHPIGVESYAPVWLGK